MKKTLKTYLVVSVMLALIFPHNFEVFRHAEAKQASDFSPGDLPIIRVISSFTPAAVIVPDKSTAINLCQNSSPVVDNLVQDSGNINLNQPASCFSLKLGTVAKSESLVVQPLAAAPVRIIVTNVRPEISAEALASGQGPAAALPLLPATYAFSVMTIFAFAKKLADKARRIKAAQPDLTLSLGRLQVLRC